MKLGIIADDYTGGTDAASFVVNAGLRCIQVNGIPDSAVTAGLPADIDAIVVSLKSRSEPKQDAINHSLAAYRWLKAQGCSQIQLKYCSTFDSTADGNIGPVTDALLDEAGLTTTIVCPSLPVNGRQVFFGNLFVNGVPLNESGMKNHPLTPMHDANLMRLMDAQSQGSSALIDFQTIEKGCEAVRRRFAQLSNEGYRYVVVDAFNDNHLDVLGQAFHDLALITGGSGISGGIAIQRQPDSSGKTNVPLPEAAKTVVISGSCSTQTNLQVSRYEAIAPSLKLDLDEVMNNPSYPQVLANWVEANSHQRYAPLVRATVDATELAFIRQHYPEDISLQSEQVFGHMVRELSARGFNSFIAAGGETSGSVTRALDVDALEIGVTIAAGVPWVRVTNHDCYLALKSGNFGSPDFFQQAQDMFLPNLEETC